MVVLLPFRAQFDCFVSLETLGSSRGNGQNIRDDRSVLTLRGRTRKEHRGSTLQSGSDPIYLFKV